MNETYVKTLLESHGFGNLLAAHRTLNGGPHCHRLNTLLLVCLQLLQFGLHQAQLRLLAGQLVLQPCRQFLPQLQLLLQSGQFVQIISQLQGYFLLDH